jgi:hypothetical protein
MPSLWSNPPENWSKLPDIAWTEELIEEAKRTLPRVDKEDPRDVMFSEPIPDYLDLNEID